MGLQMNSIQCTINGLALDFSKNRSHTNPTLAVVLGSTRHDLQERDTTLTNKILDLGATLRYHNGQSEDRQHGLRSGVLTLSE